MSARGGGGGVHTKGDGFSRLQEEMDRQHIRSLQDPPGAARIASIHFISARLLQQARFENPECDSSRLVRLSRRWRGTRDIPGLHGEGS